MIPTGYRATVDQHTAQITLPVPAGGASFSVAGVWGDLVTYGPDATSLELECRAHRAHLSATFLLTEDKTFTLPRETVQIILRAIQVVPPTALEVTITPLFQNSKDKQTSCVAG